MRMATAPNLVYILNRKSRWKKKELFRWKSFVRWSEPVIHRECWLIVKAYYEFISMKGWNLSERGLTSIYCEYFLPQDIPIKVGSEKTAYVLLQYNFSLLQQRNDNEAHTVGGNSYVYIERSNAYITAWRQKMCWNI